MSGEGKWVGVEGADRGSQAQSRQFHLIFATAAGKTREATGKQHGHRLSLTIAFSWGYNREYS